MHTICVWKINIYIYKYINCRCRVRCNITSSIQGCIISMILRGRIRTISLMVSMKNTMLKYEAIENSKTDTVRICHIQKHHHHSINICIPPVYLDICIPISVSVSVCQEKNEVYGTLSLSPFSSSWLFFSNWSWWNSSKTCHGTAIWDEHVCLSFYRRCLTCLVAVFCWWPFLSQHNQTMVVSQHTFIWLKLKCEISLKDTYYQVPSETKSQVNYLECMLFNQPRQQCTTDVESSTCHGSPLQHVRKLQWLLNKWNNTSSLRNCTTVISFLPDSWFAQATGPSNVFARVWFTNCET